MIICRALKNIIRLNTTGNVKIIKHVPIIPFHALNKIIVNVKGRAHFEKDICMPFLKIMHNYMKTAGQISLK